MRCDEPAVADLAVAVAHQDHLRGMATALLRHFANVLCAIKYVTFSADILAVMLRFCVALDRYAGALRTTVRAGRNLAHDTVEILECHKSMSARTPSREHSQSVLAVWDMPRLGESAM